MDQHDGNVTLHLLSLSAQQYYYVCHRVTSGSVATVSAQYDMDPGARPTKAQLDAGAVYAGDPDLKIVNGGNPELIWDSFKTPAVQWMPPTMYSNAQAASTGWIPNATGSWLWWVYQDDVGIDPLNDFDPADDFPFYMMSGSSSIPIFVYELTQSGPLHFFSNPGGVPQEVALSLSGGYVSGEYRKWTVTAGADKVTLRNAVTGALGSTVVYEAPGSPAYIYVRSIKESTQLHDVTIRFTWGLRDGGGVLHSVDLIDYRLTVFSPWMVADGSVVHQTHYDAFGNRDGYGSFHNYIVKPKQALQSNGIYNNLLINEQFTGQKADHVPNNWNFLTPINGVTNSAGKFTDLLAAYRPLSPNPVWPGHPDQHTAVFTQPQQVWRGGSQTTGQGIKMETEKAMNFSLGYALRQ